MVACCEQGENGKNPGIHVIARDGQWIFWESGESGSGQRGPVCHEDYVSQR